MFRSRLPTWALLALLFRELLNRQNSERRRRRAFPPSEVHFLHFRADRGGVFVPLVRAKEAKPVKAVLRSRFELCGLGALAFIGRRGQRSRSNV